MPLTPTSAKGTVGVVIEGASGEQVLMTPTTLVASMTSISAPTGSTGMRLHLILTGWTASGTLTITGTGTPGNSEVINVPVPTTQQAQSQVAYSFEYVSVNGYTAVTSIAASGPLVAGGGVLTVKGIQVAKFNIPVTAFKSTRKQPKYSPNEFSGLMARDKRLIAQTVDADINALDSDFYGDLSLYWVYMMLGIPTWTSLPTTPTVLLAAAALTGSQTLTTQPSAPGMKLILTITAFTTPGTVTINGTAYGLTISEQISITAAGTYYSANSYSTVTTITNASTAATMAVTGVLGWKGIVTSENAVKQTAALEHYDGSASWTHPFSFAADGDFMASAKGETKLTMKGFCQDKLAIGDRTTNPLQVSRVASLGIPLTDMPLAGWQTNVFIDPINGTAGTTAFLDPEDTIKIILKTPGERKWTFNNQQAFTRSYAHKYECSVDMTYDIVNLLQYEQFRQNLKQYLVVQTLGEFIGNTGGLSYYKGWTWTLPVRYESEYGQEAEPSKGNVTAKPKLKCEYDALLGGSYQLQIITKNPPTYNS